MNRSKKYLLLAVFIYAILTTACVYIVLPEGLEPAADAKKNAVPKSWGAVVTKVEKTASGDVKIDLTIRNDTGDWAKMDANPKQPAILTAADGKTSNCGTVFVSTGGHRLAPGFQMRGYVVDSSDTTQTQLLYVECQGVNETAGARLNIRYASFGGILDDYDPQANKTEGTLELNLDDVVAGLAYPIANQVEGLVLPASTPITGLSENVVTLLDAQRTENGFQFTWQNFNPTKFPLKTHIGIPPVIGADGIIYGVYETLDIPPVPTTPANENAQWTTAVAVPEDVAGFYILLSVESRKPRTYINYVLDIHEK